MIVVKMYMCGREVSMEKELNRVQKLRKRTGLSQAKFAAKFGIPTQNIQRWEQNIATPPSYVTDMIEKLLDIEDNFAGK